VTRLLSFFFNLIEYVRDYDVVFLVLIGKMLGIWRLVDNLTRRLLLVLLLKG